MLCVCIYLCVSFLNEVFIVAIMYVRKKGYIYIYKGYVKIIKFNFHGDRVKINGVNKVLLAYAVCLIDLF